MTPDHLKAMDLLHRLSQVASHLCDAFEEGVATSEEVQAVDDVLNDYYRFTQPDLRFVIHTSKPAPF